MSNIRSVNMKVYRELAARHQEEFDGLMAESYAEVGRVYVPAQSPEEKRAARRAAQVAKARAKLDALHAEFPELAETDDEQVT